MRRNREVLRNQIAVLLERIEKVESQPPFSLRDQLADDEQLEKRRLEIEAQIALLDKQRAALEAHLLTLIDPASDGKIFGPN